MRIIICIDLDSFYASLEERRNPELKGKAIAVCVYSGRTKDSGAVATANYKAREFGIKAGIPISIAKGMDKEKVVVFLPVDMDYYRDVSEKIMNLMRTYADKFEQISIDEAYLDVTQRCKGSFGNAKKIAIEVKKIVFEKEGLTCTAGIGENKLIAKMASGIKKPNGLTMVMPRDSQKFIWSFELRKLHGVGVQTEKILKEMGVSSVKALALADLGKLKQAFGGNKALLLHNKALGIDDEEVEYSEKQQLSKMGTLKQDTRDLGEIMEKIGELAAVLEKRIKKQDVFFRNVAIIAITPGLQMYTKSKTLPGLSDSIQVAKETARELMEFFLEENPEIILKRCGIRVSGFEKKKQKTLGEF